MLAARVRAGGKGLVAVGGGDAVEQPGEARGEVTGSPSAVSDGHCTVPQRVFSPARVATSCVRGPLGACVATYGRVVNGEGLLLALEAVPFSHRASADVFGKRGNWLIEPRTGRVEFQTNTRFTRILSLPVSQFGDMACPEADLNHQVASAAAMSNRGRMG
jgi:hypothetical protein